MSALTDVFTNIANAIRSKKGVSTTYKPSQMADAINSIPTGITPSGTKSDTYTSNGTYSVDVTNYATHSITINVPEKVDIRTINRSISSTSTFYLDYGPKYIIGYHNDFKSMFIWFNYLIAGQLIARSNKYLYYTGSMGDKDGMYSFNNYEHKYILSEAYSSTTSGDWTIISAGDNGM